MFLDFHYPYILKSLVNTEVEGRFSFTKPIIETDIYPFFKFPAIADTISSSVCPPFKFRKFRKNISSANPNGSTTTSVDMLSQLYLRLYHILIPVRPA